MADTDDPFLWLEEVQGEKALAFVAAQNARTLAALTGPDFERDRAAFRAILTAPDKIPFVTKRGRFLYNLWQDENNPRGLWRRTTIDSYRTPTPAWDTLIDVDALGRAEGENWVWNAYGWSTLPPNHRRALILLSRGGADASVVREFDLEARAFIADGFALPEGKSSAEWLDADTLLVASPLGNGHATSSGYARTVRRWRRGTPFSDAVVVFEGLEADVSVSASVDHEPGFERTFLARQFSFFDTEHFQFDGASQRRRIEVPTDADLSVHREWLTLRLRSAWKPKDREFPADSLIVARFDAFMAGERDFHPLFEPGERRTIRSFSWARDRLAISLLDDMRTRIDMAVPTPAGWQIEALPVPATETADIWSFGYDGAVSSTDFLLTLSGYLTPTSLNLVEPGKPPVLLKQLPPKFDASGLAVTLHETVAEDGVRIPYFQVGPKDLPRGADTPTILYGYGGFQVSLLPSYSTGVGKAWLERGGVYVVANIRGGGEFGSAWHKAGIRENKKRAHDDFAAVAADLVRRGVTTPKHLACWGGSNGGLLVGNMLTRHPELFGAVWCTIPLLDMRRYSKLLAGASWIAEYGDPDVPEDWAFLKDISPYQLAAPGKNYPPILLWTSARDDRVHPGHARKMAALLDGLGYQVYFYEPPQGGHGTSDFEQTAHMWALGYAFLRKTIGAPISK